MITGSPPAPPEPTSGHEPSPSGRGRNPERSRERILAAALEEFAANGYAGTRVKAIAQRAGLNKQLISHYFGGKEGLYRAVMGARRSRPGADLSGRPAEYPDELAALFDRGRGDPRYLRVLLWEALEGNAGADTDDDVRRAIYRERLAGIHAEQDAGHLPADLDPELLYLTLVGASVYPLLLPHVCELVTGASPSSEAFAARYRDHLIEFARVLGASTREPTP
jgi:TetR/AcrR family transcriptional regulator